eukprot:97043-Pleurochrysis_carterae.AAC.4
MDRFFYAAYPGPTVGSQRRVPRRRVTVDHFTRLQLALQVGGHKVPSPHAHAVGGGERGEGAQKVGRKKAQNVWS